MDEKAVDRNSRLMVSRRITVEATILSGFENRALMAG
jgi:hypothetical protein